MEKKLILITILFLLSAKLFSKEEDQPQKERDTAAFWLLNHPSCVENTKNQIISAGFTIPFRKDLIDDKLCADFSYNFTNLYTTASTGIEKSSNIISFYADDTFWFMNLYSVKEEKAKNRLGAELFFNITHYENLVTYFNIALGINNTVYFKHDLVLKTQLLFDLSFAKLILDDCTDTSYNWWDILLLANLDYRLPVPQNIHIYAQMTNFTPYSLKRFYAPTFSFGSTWEPVKQFTLKAQLELHYLDLFCYSRYFDYSAFSFWGEYKL